MANLGQFFLAILLLLLVPGPTNTLLFTASAASGFRRSLSLLAAEGLGYLVAIHALIFLKGFLVQPLPAIQYVLRGGCALYIIVLARKLWQSSDPTAYAVSRGVTFLDVLVTTLLNPKAFVFAFVLLPYRFGSDWRFVATYFILTQLTILGAGLCWIGLGDFIRSGRLVSIPMNHLRRISSVGLCVFSVLIVVPH